MRTTASIAPRKLQFFTGILRFHKIYRADILSVLEYVDRWKSCFVATVRSTLGKLEYSKIAMFHYEIEIALLLNAIFGEVGSLASPAQGKIPLIRVLRVDSRLIVFAFFPSRALRGK